MALSMEQDKLYKDIDNVEKRLCEYHKVGCTYGDVHETEDRFKDCNCNYLSHINKRRISLERYLKGNQELLKGNIDADEKDYFESCIAEYEAELKYIELKQKNTNE